MISMGSKPSKGKSRGGRRNSINNNTNNKNTNNVKSTIGGGGADRNAHGTTTILSGGGGVGGAAAFAIRQRSDSTDSTRGAFYQGSGRGTSVSRNLQNAERVAPTVREVVTGHHERRPRRLKQGSAHHRHEQNASMASLASYVMHSIDPLGDGTTAAAAMDDIHSPPPSPHPTPLREGSTGMPASPRTTEARKALFAGTIAGGGKNLLPPQSHQYHHRSTVKDATKTKDLDIPESRGSIYYFAQNSDNPNYGAMGLNDDDDDGPGGNVSRNTSLFGDHALLAVSAHRKENVHPPQDDPNIQSTTTQEDEIQMFSSMVHASEKPRSHDTHNNNNNRGHHHHHHSEAEGPSSADISDTSLFSSDSDADSYAALGTTTKDCVHRCLSMLDPTDWLMKDALLHEGTGACLCDQRSYTLAGLIRHFFYNPLSPEFSSLQQFDWAIVLGIVIGLYTAFWKWLIDGGVHVIWETVPQKLLEWGVFTGPDGAFPLPHFIWIVPAVFGGVLSYIFAVLPHQIPDQNEWINAVHSRGVQDYRTALPLFLLSTAGMWSGLGLGPELPLVLTGGMAGSWLALLTKQSMLQARVMNLTGASAAVAGFFGFPMAGALFVLEIPHRMGLQYFEALSPATVASIVAVLSNRLVTGNDVTGYFSYPFLTSSLPSSIFIYAIVYGFYGCLIGTLYTHGAKLFKTIVQHCLHAPQQHHNEFKAQDKSDNDFALANGSEESVPLVAKRIKKQSSDKNSVWNCVRSYFCFVIPHKPKRAAVAGTLAGAMVGVIGIFVPHVLFYGEAQLQNLIDKGRTPLPIFGDAKDLSAYAYCLIDAENNEEIRAGFSIACSSLIMVAKTVVIGLSLGTGIIGGQFWGPLCVGCAASHLLTDVVELFHSRFGFGHGLAAHPCVVILCTMGAAHVVTFRSHMAIMLILTLTISAFNPEAEDSTHAAVKVAGDYSAVFPLLVVSVFLSLMASRDTIFYATQRARGDITAVPEVLCQPGMEGSPLVVGYVHSSDEISFGDSSSESDGHESDIEIGVSSLSREDHDTRAIDSVITQNDIEKTFAEVTSFNIGGETESLTQDDHHVLSTKADDIFAAAVSGGNVDIGLSSARLDELLGISQDADDEAIPVEPAHRRIQSAPFGVSMVQSRSRTTNYDETNTSAAASPPVAGNHGRTSSSISQKGVLVRVTSFGDIQDHQPSLMDQARMRSASSVAESHRRVPSLPNAPLIFATGDSTLRIHRRVPSSGRHSRKPSDASQLMLNSVSCHTGSEPGGALSLDDIEQSFSAVVNEKVGYDAFTNKSLWSAN